MRVVDHYFLLLAKNAYSVNPIRGVMQELGFSYLPYAYLNNFRWRIPDNAPLNSLI